MPIPDFFIVGAPKCGTTSLYRYLAGHPDIGMSRTKEPGFFAADILNCERVKTLKDYLSNFDGAAGKSRIGEASTAYLASPAAPQAILGFNPSAQIIIMLRNPIDVLHALHSQRLFGGIERIRRFEAAIESREVRYWQSGSFRGIRAGGLHYRETTKFSVQIRRYFNVFHKDRIHIILFDEFVRAPGIAYENVLAFLGLPSDGRGNFEIVNKNRRARSQALEGLMRHPMLSRLKRSFPRLGRGVRAMVNRFNLVHEPRAPIEPRFRHQLEAEYAPEIRDLLRLLDRNVTAPSRVEQRPLENSCSVCRSLV